MPDTSTQTPPDLPPAPRRPANEATTYIVFIPTMFFLVMLIAAPMLAVVKLVDTNSWAVSTKVMQILGACAVVGALPMGLWAQRNSRMLVKCAVWCVSAQMIMVGFAAMGFR